jgi:hypothetical protein
MRRICTAVSLVLVTHLTTASAQVIIVDENHPTANEILTYFATVGTPVGGLPPIATSTILGEPQSGVALALRFGHVNASPGITSLNNFGASAVLPLGTGSTLSLTGGFSAPTSGSTALMLAIGGDTRLGSMAVSADRGSSHVDFALNGELGYGKPTDATLWAGEVGLPISLVPGPGPRDALRVVPFLTPAFTFANFDSDDPRVVSQSAVHFMLGGGLAFYNRTSPLEVSLGLQYVAVNGSNLQFGLSVVLGGR